jgi:hypothetical protein
MKKIHLKYERNTIEFNEILEFFINSWRRGFELLDNILYHNEELKAKNVYIPEKPHRFDYLIEKYENKIRDYLENSFLEYKINVMRGIPYDIFKGWLEKGHDLEIVYYNKRMKVCMSLLSLKEIVLVP